MPSVYLKKKRYYKAWRGRKRRPRGARAQRRRYRVRKRKARACRCDDSNAFKKLKKRVESGMGTYIYKTRASNEVSCAQNSYSTSVFDGSKVSFIENAIDNLPTFDPSNPGTYTFVNFNTGLQQRQIEIASTFTSCTIKNNYRVPVRFRIYLCIPREDTSITPSEAMENGLTDVGSGLDTTTPMLSPFDSPQFNDLWKVVKTRKGILQPGRGAAVSHVIGSFMFDPSFVDSHGLVYQGRYGAHAYLVRVEGLLGHDTVTLTQHGNLEGGVDVQRLTKYVIKYEAGADIKYIEVVDGNDAMTADGVVTVLDNTNQVFNVA